MADKPDFREIACPAPEQVPSGLMDQYLKLKDTRDERPETRENTGVGYHRYDIPGADLRVTLWRDRSGQEQIQSIENTKTEQLDGILFGKRDQVDFVVPKDGGKTAHVHAFKGFQNDYWKHQQVLVKNEQQLYVEKRGYELDNDGKIVKSKCFDFGAP